MDNLAGTDFPKNTSDLQGVSVSATNIYTQNLLIEKSIDLLNLRHYFNFCVLLNCITLK
jgi:hypothetical protein